MDLEEQKKYILSGRMYNDLTPELIKAREYAVYLTNEYNNSFGEPQHERENILKRLM